MNNRQTDAKETLDRLLASCLKIPLASGASRTAIPFLAVLKESGPTLLSHGVLKPSLCIVLQGRKRLQIGAKEIEYTAGDFLSASIDMPVNGQVTIASSQSPYIALRIDLTPGEVAAVASEANLDLRPETGLQPGLFVGKPCLEVLEGFEKLLRLSLDARAAEYLAPAIKREIIYRLLDGEEGPLFYKNMLLHQDASGIGKVIDWIKGNFDSPLTIEELAELGNMSISNLHYKFKEVTSMAPLQYQKRLRLQEARRLLLDGANVTETALQVGYQSSTQFSREYKRLFGLSPLRHIRVTIHEGGLPPRKG
ncbi:helix-turn-helix domain-containing protein [Paenibacillus sp. 5J-6]|uniref:Helix-turn-helix domain-containing protein n=1 Tax=Paenibacillus silvestris TaxID=2606219 RepID=A0A6L8UTW3_9BACL|nr:AraC family transcriptional regulator [Paenibacillus silvestris]MZQ80609.1 helix-turn-helix domain-containing protein [Paenibacillus silvestris]